MNALEARGIRLAYGGVIALDSVDLAVTKGEIHAVIGPNGAGKTTLLNVCSGISVPQAGQIFIAGANVSKRRASTLSRSGMARTFQNIQLFPHATALENVLVGASAQAPLSTVSSILALPVARRLEREARQTAADCLGLVGLLHRSDDRAGTLPYGSQRVLEIARALATKPSVLLLDEPGAGFNSEEKIGLASLIRKMRSDGVSVVLVEHDMPLVMGVADRITVLNFGRKIAEGTPDEIANDPAVIDAYLGTDYQSA